MVWHTRQLCSFCRRLSADVAKLVAGARVHVPGPRVYIRDRCVAASAAIMAES
jgi:hypothetical protein